MNYNETKRRENGNNISPEEIIITENKLINPTEERLINVQNEINRKKLSDYLESLTISYFRKASENIAMNMIDFQQWEEYYEMFIQAIQTGVLKDEFIKKFAQTLKLAQVTVFLDYDQDAYVQIIGKLEELINSKKDNLKR